MNQYRELNDVTSQWASITDLTILEAQARSEARKMRDEYISTALSKLVYSIKNHFQTVFRAPFSTRSA